MSVQYIGRPGAHWGQHLKTLREARGWSQAQLAERCGLTDSRLSQIESGSNTNVSLYALLGLQRAFGLDTIEALLGTLPSGELAGVAPWDTRGCDE
jgi:transcriptional regulator with XRE-family HTH domain